MTLDFKDGYQIELSDIEILAIVSKSEHIKCRGLNVCMIFDEENVSSESLQEINTLIGSGKILEAHVVTNDYKIPVDIHGGNVGQCYFGYVNPTLFD